MNEKDLEKAHHLEESHHVDKAHRQDLASSLCTMGPQRCAIEKDRLKILGASDHLGRQHVTAPAPELEAQQA